MNTKTSPSAGDLLRQAADIIDERAAQRDCQDGERSMASTVKAFWSIHGKQILERGTMTEEQGWTFMELLKAARGTAGSFQRDDWVDKIGYAALGAEAAIRNNGVNEIRVEQIHTPSPNPATRSIPARPPIIDPHI